MSTRTSLRLAFWVGWVVLVLLAAVWIGLREPSQPATIQQRVDQVASTLRCPVCRDLSVADSPSALARSMRETIAEKLREGETPDQIRASFVRSYGSWVLLTPPPSGLATAARLAPFAAIVLGAIFLFAVLRRLRRSVGNDVEEVPPGERRMLEEARGSMEATEG